MHSLGRHGRNGKALFEDRYPDIEQFRLADVRMQNLGRLVRGPRLPTPVSAKPGNAVSRPIRFPP